MYKIIVLAPSNFAPSGGPEALHQLVYMCNVVEPGSAAILYEPENITESSIAPYKKYNCPIIFKKDINSHSLIVIPEIWPEHAKQFSNKCALWWLSVNFFGSHGQSDLSDIDIHLAQSVYAFDHLSKITTKPKLMLTDWIDLESELKHAKNDYICVNPAKGLELINSFSSMHSDLAFIRMQGMHKAQVMQAFSQSKVYIDFGHHPGRDRMPREAALNDCVVFVRREGAASFYDDVPIDDWFKFININELDNKIYKVINNYDSFIEKQKDYKTWCINNRESFKSEVKNLLSFI